MRIKIFKKRPLLWLYIGGGVLLVAAVWAWCFKISLDPERVFWSTIEQGLSTQGVTVQAEQASSGSKAKQTIRFSFGGSNLSHAVTKLTQPGTTVVSEMLGTPTADYMRYVDIKTDQKKKDGGKLDFSKVLGVWSVGPQGSGQLFQQAVFGSTLPVGGMGVPIGYLEPGARAELIKQIKDDVVYQVDLNKVKKERVDGRLRYTYDVALQAVGYVAAIKSFAQHIGLHTLDEVDPAAYKGQKPFAIRITVDARARQVTAIAAVDSEHRQTYSGYGVPVQLVVPKNAISSADLQKRLSSLQ